MRMLPAVIMLCICTPIVFAQEGVRTYKKKNGTIVQSHVRTKPNKTKADNYSTKGNRNPYTGKRGKKKLY